MLESLPVTWSSKYRLARGWIEAFTVASKVTESISDEPNVAVSKYKALSLEACPVRAWPETEFKELRFGSKYFEVSVILSDLSGTFCAEDWL